MRRILVIEDNPTGQLVIEMILRKMTREQQAEVVCTGTYVEGLALAGRQAWDAILLDLKMPDADDQPASVAAIKQAAGYVPILVLTGAPDPDGDVRRGCLAAGAAEFVRKDDVAADPAMLPRLIEELTTGENGNAR